MNLRVLVFFTVTLTRLVSAQTNAVENAAREWAAVTQWIGFWEASETRTINYRNSRNGALWANSVREAQTSGTFRLRRARALSREDLVQGELEWTGSGIERWLSAHSSAESGASAHATQAGGAGRVPSASINFRIKLKDGLAAFGPGAVESWPTGRMTGWIGTDENRRSVDREIALDRAVPTLYKGERQAGWFEFRATPGHVTIRDERSTQKTEGDRTHGYVYRGRVVLSPVYDDLECVVSIDGYADWLPQGSIEDATKPGSALVARAVLRSKTGRSDDIPEVDRFRFELLETSREPGVCLNWPLGAKDESFDFRLADLAEGSSGPDPARVARFLRQWDATSTGQRNPDDLPTDTLQLAFPVVDEDGQRGELLSPPKNRRGEPFAATAIECFDFGAKSELRVVCVLADGREILGLMRDELGEQDIVRLPRRLGADWVAAKWREVENVTQLVDHDDDEHVEGQSMNGDGFTLYEEYRGWAQAGHHIRGDPKRKDFFVLNQIGVAKTHGSDGADGRSGIALFARISKLRVHARLTESEFDWRVRVMNANRRDGAHRVKQHGVYIVDVPWREGEVAGGKTISSDPTHAGRPATTQAIGMLRRTDPHSVFTGEATAFANLSRSDAESLFDVAIAHELAHAVGVEHHGEFGDSQIDLYFQGAGHPMNPTGLPRFVPRLPPSDTDLAETMFRGRAKEWSDFDRGPTIHLYWEDTREDVAELLGPAFENALERERNDSLIPGDRRAYAEQRAARFARWGKSADFWEAVALQDSVAKGTTKAEWQGTKFSGQGGFHRRIYYANPELLHSGDVGCIMRYHFANAYPVANRRNAYYLIRPGGNSIGHEFCRSPAGTGGNHVDHEPQSRFGHCAPGRGNCYGQICPNDAIPPAKS